jgi:hypothetical protein
MPPFRVDPETRNTIIQRSSYKIIDSQGNVVDFSPLVETLELMRQELTAIRIMISSETKSNLTDKDILNL